MRGQSASPLKTNNKCFSAILGTLVKRAGVKMVPLKTLLCVLTLAVLGQCAVISIEGAEKSETSNVQEVEAEKQSDDLKTAASQSYVGRDYWGNGYDGVTGNGILDDTNYYNGGYGYDNGYRSYYGNSNYGGYNRGYSGYYGSNGGYGGYGGNGGNGGLNSYYGYNYPYYQGNNHLGYGYYKRPGYGSIYSGGVTPNLVTGYRGYTR